MSRADILHGMSRTIHYVIQITISKSQHTETKFCTTTTMFSSCIFRHENTYIWEFH